MQAPIDRWFAAGLGKSSLSFAGPLPHLETREVDLETEPRLDCDPGVGGVNACVLSRALGADSV